MHDLRSLFDLHGRVALVTGGSRGLGAQVATALSAFGAKVALVGRKVADLDEAIAALQERGAVAGAFPADLSDAPEAAIGLVDRVLDRFGRIDILINNAGTTWGAPAEDYPIAGWNKVLGLNITGLFLLTQAVANRAFLPQGGGVVLNIASIEGLQGHHPDRIGTIAYNTAKGAVVNLTRALAAEWGPRNIRVNALAPGFFPTRMADSEIREHGAELIRQTPRGRLGGEQDLMGPALLLVSDAGAHITGQILAVDGGMTII